MLYTTHSSTQETVLAMQGEPKFLLIVQVSPLQTPREIVQTHAHRQNPRGCSLTGLTYFIFLILPFSNQDFSHFSINKMLN